MFEVPFSTPEIRALVKAAYGNVTSHRNVKVETRTKVQISDYWSEGSRVQAVFVRLADLATVAATAMPTYARQQKNNPLQLAIADVELPEGYCVVEHHIFRSKSLGYWVVFHPTNLSPSFLPAAPAVDERDRRILATFRGLKSGPYRQEALTRLAFTAEDRDRLAKAGFLRVSANGATGITNEGRSACAEARFENGKTEV